MPLSDLNDELYKQPSDSQEKNSNTGNSNPLYQNQPTENPFAGEESWIREEKGLTQKQKKIIGAVSGALALLLIIAGGAFYFSNARKNAFQQDRVAVFFDGPKEVDSTQLVSYAIKYKNDNKVKLEDVELSLNYSENFQPSAEGNVNLKQLNAGNSKIHIGDIKAGSEGEVRITGVFYAPKDTPVYLRGTLKYRPSNLGSHFETKNQIGINIATSPIFLELSAPPEASSGDSVSFVIDYKNMDARALNDAQLHVFYPEGFEFVSSEPSPSQNKNVWYFGSLESEKGGKVVIQGRLESSSATERVIRAQIGKIGGDGRLVVYNERQKSTKITEAPFALDHYADGFFGNVASQGDLLRYVIKYKNVSQALLNDAILVFEISSDALDYSKISTGGGYFDSKTRTVTWKSSEIRELSSLAAGAEGVVNVTVPIISPINAKGEGEKNFSVNSVVRMSSSSYLDQGGQSKTVSSSKLELKINSRVAFGLSGFYNDARLKNSGSMPMAVGKETDFALHWNVSSNTNDLEGVKIVSSLPSGVRWTNVLYPSGEKISYNERTNEVVWEVGNISAGTGVYKPSREVVFQVRVVPQMNDAGKEMKLLNASVLTAKDSYTGSEVRLENKEKTTQLEEDKTISYDYFKVIE